MCIFLPFIYEYVDVFSSIYTSFSQLLSMPLFFFSFPLALSWPPYDNNKYPRNSPSSFSISFSATTRPTIKTLFLIPFLASHPSFFLQQRHKRQRQNEKSSLFSKLGPVVLLRIANTVFIKDVIGIKVNCIRLGTPALSSK